MNLIDQQFSIIAYFSDTGQFGNNLTCVKQWTGADYKDMVKDWIPACAPLLKGHPNHFIFIISVTDLILKTSYHSHTETSLKCLQDVPSGISSNIHCFLPYLKSHSLSIIPKIHSFLHFMGCIMEMDSANNNNNKISQVAHKICIKNGYHSSDNVNYTMQLLRWEMHLCHVNSVVNILQHIVKADLFLQKASRFR